MKMTKQHYPCTAFTLQVSICDATKLILLLSTKLAVYYHTCSVEKA